MAADDELIQARIEHLEDMVRRAVAAAYQMEELADEMAEGPGRCKTYVNVSKEIQRVEMDWVRYCDTHKTAFDVIKNK